MQLPDAIDHALALTRELRAGLTGDRPGTWDDVLARRADAMADFQDAHLAADPETRSRCREALQELADADRELQRLATEALAAAATDFRANLRTLPAGSAAYDTGPLQGAVNRRA
jgi:hypothetical protein